MKNQKGVNLVSLSVAVIVIITIVGTVLYNVRTNLGVQKLKAMQADIENLRGKVANYYLQYGALPILKQQEIEDSILSDNIKNVENITIDTGKYYVIDLEAMENITLTYGEDYENLKEKSEEIIKTLSNGTLTDVYIINSVSHNIFYVHGVKYEGKTYYNQYQDEEKSKIGTSNTNININIVEKNSKPLLEIKKGEKAPENRNAIYIDEKEHQAIIPAGFTVSDIEGESSIETGLVIRDDSENEFVWIPVGIPKKSNSNENIILGRYRFSVSTDETAGTIIESKFDGSDMHELYNESYFVEESPRPTGSLNAVAKNIDDFKIKTNLAGGFWIGRYEARTTSSESTRGPSSATLTPVTENPENYIYNYIKQSDASKLAREMYADNNYFESDLINSYAWDTATLFLQEYDNRTDEVKSNSNYKAKYSIQIGLNEAHKGKGTNYSNVNEYNKDKICNIYDMAGNYLEWTTESDKKSNYPCTKRGGALTNQTTLYTNRRSSNNSTDVIAQHTFRPILYIK